MSRLIDGLPDEISVQILARVPLLHQPALQLVSASWRSALTSPSLFLARTRLACTETLLCILAFDPENTWQLYDPLRDRWITLPVMPSQTRHLARFGCTSVDGKLFVIGGGSDRVDPLTGDHDGIFASKEVWSYDPLRRRWHSRNSMLVPRAMFACCALNGKIIVAGGFTNCRKSVSKCELYDPLRDRWDPLPDLKLTHSSACTGLVIDGRMHVLHKGLSSVQILSEDSTQWIVEDYNWLAGPTAMVEDELYVLSNGCILKQRREREKQSGSNDNGNGNGNGNGGGNCMVSCASEFQSRIGFGMIGVGEEIYLVGGVIGPGPTNQCIKQLSDVDILNVRSERPTWRNGSGMTKSRGSVLGCALLTV